MAVPITAAAGPITSAQPNWARSGCEYAGRFGMARENVPNPVQASSPTKISAPMPAASRPGSRATSSMAPPRPATSISRNAAGSGEPNRVAMAAKLPAEPTTASVCAGISFLEKCTASTARPLPSAIRGASGPSAAPSDSVASAARNTPGISAAVMAPRGLNPSAGEWPPLPGRYRMVSPTSRPARASGSSGHHSGSPWKPSPLGSWV